MEKIIEKASILIEALPYIKEFYGKTVVIKYGGSAIESGDESIKEAVFKDIAIMKYVGIRVVIVHGGGKKITEIANKLGKKSEFKDGYRVTDNEMINITEMVLNHVNKEIVTGLINHGIKAVGISGRDAGLIYARKKSDEYGLVGKITKVNPKIIEDLEKENYVVVISPLASWENNPRVPLNINADDAASSIAASLKAKKFFLLTDVDGIYKDISNKNSLISSLTLNEAIKLIKEDFIKGGMIPKVNSCINAVKNGVEKAHIINGNIPHALLLEMFTEKGIGTQIIG
ncbi:MAG TPA: acetylglutamate kinase [Spirochaetota bacterium]|nr:acetylglutamate kinase [Spirochaetota bacterium]HOM37839.1 acetylglutamate kinase [Spirochaetota bacterium]HPQ49284.1 acetylglutamate kinase [Spirochaetota bacterium]